MKRRQLLSTFLKTLGAVIAGVIAVPLGINALSPVLQNEPEEDWKPLGPIDNFKLGKVAPALVNTNENLSEGSLDQVKVFVWRKSAADFVVYSRSCTDLGCPLNYDSGSEWFFCPCHGGIFDKEGKRRAGPPKKPMWRYTTRIRNEVLEIDLRSVPAMA